MKTLNLLKYPKLLLEKEKRVLEKEDLQTQKAIALLRRKTANSRRNLADPVGKTKLTFLSEESTNRICRFFLGKGKSFTGER
jgi:hypothetical protein